MASLIGPAEQLREPDPRFGRFLSEIDLGALMLDRNGKVVFINDHLLELLERSRAEMVRADWMDVVPARQRSQLRGIYRDSISSGTSPGSREASIVTRSGEERRLAWTSVVQLAASWVGLC